MSSQAYIVSDSTGETGHAMARALCAQFPDLEVKYRVFSDRQSLPALEAVFATLEHMPVEEKDHVLIFNSIMIPEVSQALSDMAKAQGYLCINIFQEGIRRLEGELGQSAAYLPGLTRNINKDYLHKISSIEFAVRFDDGRDPRGLLLADIVLLGVSRTSKTPLSMFLANKGYNVANLPLVPEIPLPQELDRVDPRRIIGLIISPERLNEIRMGRLAALGLQNTQYADDGRIHKELDYAKEVFQKLDCPYIDVTDSTIEASAAQILDLVRKHFADHICRYEDPDRAF